MSSAQFDIEFRAVGAEVHPEGTNLLVHEETTTKSEVHAPSLHAAETAANMNADDDARELDKAVNSDTDRYTHQMDTPTPDNGDVDWEPDEEIANENVKHEEIATEDQQMTAQLGNQDRANADTNNATLPLVKDEHIENGAVDGVCNQPPRGTESSSSDEIQLVSENLVTAKRKPKSEPGASDEQPYVKPPAESDVFQDDELMTSLQQQATKTRRLVQERHRLLNEATEELRTIEKLIGDRYTELRRATDAAFDWNAHSFPWDDVLAKELQDVFHISSFRPLQREALNATLSGRDVYAILPTGAGKSLIYQLAAVVDRGLTLVVTPLIALSVDQQKALRKLKIRAEALDSTVPKSVSTQIYETVLPRNGEVQRSSHPRKKQVRPQRKARKKMSNDELTWIRDDMETTILFVTPEQVVRSKRLMNRVEMMYEQGHLSRIVIDEAHCCSAWGHDYRADYRKLGTLKRQCPQTPIIALSATSSPETTDDVCQILETPHCVIFRGSVDRPNLFYEVRRKSDDEDEVIADISCIVLSEFTNQCGIVYVLSRRETETYAAKLRELGVSCECYHGDMDQTDRFSVHRAWQRGELQIVVATIAFGLGIDNPNVRFVLHATIASSMEGYYQESGRAGRDGQPAKCIVLHRAKDFARMSSFVADKGGARHAKMYEIYQYATGRRFNEEGNEVAATCRRALLAKAFNESPPTRSKEDQLSCCDLCAGMRNPSDHPVLTEVTPLAQSVVRIMAHQNSTRPNEKVTILALATAWGNRGARGGRMRGEEPVADRSLTLELRLEIIIGLIFKGALEEYHRHTAHSINAYVTEGPNSARILKKGASVRLVLRSEDAEIVSALGRQSAT